MTRRALRRHAPAGTLLHGGGRECVGLLAVQSGRLRAYILSGDGREITLYRLLSRDVCLFSAACMLRGARLDILVEAEKDAWLWVIPAAVYEDMMRASAALANYTNALMADRFSEVTWLLGQVLWSRQDRRLASFLLEERTLQGEDALAITHERIAAHLGTAPRGCHPAAALLPVRRHGPPDARHGDADGRRPPARAGGDGRRGRQRRRRRNKQRRAMKTMPNWQQTLTVEISDCDATGRWKPSAMLIRMQEAAECHAAELGFPRQRLLEAGMCWVIYRQRMTLRRVPEFGEALRLCTWPAPVEGVLFPRHYRFETPAGAPLAEATSSWVLIDIHTRRPLRPTALPGSIPTDPEAERPLPGMLRLPADVQALETRRVRWSELDVNGHMNNARYADWLCDALDARRLPDARPVGLAD